MTTDPIISFAQDRFSSDDLPSRARAPEWLVTNDDLGIIPIESGELVGVDLTEGDSVDGPAPSADGTTPDALAFYLPFHYYQHNWGIYVRAAGVWEIARKLGLLDSVPDNATLEGAYNLLYMHERFHFLAEYAA